MGYFELALLAAILTGMVSGLVGTLVVLRQRTFFAQALTHATFPGAVVAATVGANIMIGSAIAAVALVGVMVIIGRTERQGAHVASGIVLTAGFAVGVILQALNPGLPIHVDSYLVGSILTVNERDVATMACVLVVTLGVLVFAGKEILFDTFDPTGFRAAGYRRWPIEIVVLVLITATVVTVMPVAGAILAIALIAGPAATARIVARTPTQMFIIAPTLGALCGIIGLLGSRAYEVSAGAAISLTAAAFFVFALGIRYSAQSWLNHIMSRRHV
jgi:zinc/manganese transport system permease protein